MRSILCSKNVFLIVILISFKYGNPELFVPPECIHFLEPGENFQCEKTGLQIFCHHAKSKYLINIWKTISMNFNIHVDTYELYDGRTPEEVLEKHNDNQRSWGFTSFFAKRNKQIKINPFQDTCIGVHTNPNLPIKYTVLMTQINVDMWRLLGMILGIMLFISASKLSRNLIFYYLCGVSIGVMTSIIVLVYLLSKFLPRGKTMYLMVATGWAMSFYVLQLLWDNAQFILMQHKEWVIWYTLSTSVISFIICYRFGPVTNPKTKKIIQWFLQILGLVIIYYSSYFHEASLSCCVILVLLYNFPITAVCKGRKYWKKIFPETRRLLTDNEYHKEGIRETNRALNELQTYCSSPECNTWQTMLKLKDPIRFAKFMEGASHLSDNETQDHDAEITKIIENCEYTDEDDDDDDDDTDF